MAKEETAVKKKRPTALKRDMQNMKKRLINKGFKSEVRTAMRGFESALKGGNKESLKSELSTVFGIMDRGVKRGVFTKNKANRTKARAAAKVAALA